MEKFYFSLYLNVALLQTEFDKSGTRQLPALCWFIDQKDQEKTMRQNSRYTFTAILVLLLFLGSAASAAAQVKRVQMHIGGYLCGN